MAVDNTHSQYNAKATMWERCRDCCEGSDAVKAKGQKYLPQLTDQTPNEYEAYKARANFYGATGRTVNGLAGMVFRKEPKVELPGPVEDCAGDITLTGVPLESSVVAKNWPPPTVCIRASRPSRQRESSRLRCARNTASSSAFA